MKKILLLFILCVFAENVFSQAYKRINLLDKNITFSHLQLLDGDTGGDRDIFEIRERKEYSENKTYEVAYFKGNAKEMYTFFCSLMELSRKIDSDNGVAYIRGVRVELIKRNLNIWISIYDNKESVYCYYTEKQWQRILDKFTTYCDENKIVYNCKQ